MAASAYNLASSGSATTTARRAAMFHEAPLETVERVALGLAYALKPSRWRRLGTMARLWWSHLVHPTWELPDPERTLDESGVAGVVPDLDVKTLLDAYKRGLFPSGHFGKLYWTSPPERSVLYFDEHHMAKSLRRLMRKGDYSVTFDRDFEGVIKACAGRRQGRWHVTWITPRIMRAYAALFDAGYAHSFEVWNSRGELAGGGYGVAIGRIFFTESQFSLEDNTSKLGFAVLNWHLAHWGFILNDGKAPTSTTRNMGFRIIPRREFLRDLAHGTATAEQPRRWVAEADPEMVADWQPRVDSPGIVPVTETAEAAVRAD